MSWQRANVQAAATYLRERIAAGAAATTPVRRPSTRDCSTSSIPRAGPRACSASRRRPQSPRSPFRRPGAAQSGQPGTASSQPRPADRRGTPGRTRPPRQPLMPHRNPPDEALRAAPDDRVDHRHGRRLVQSRPAVERHHAEAAERRLPRHPREPERDGGSRRARLRVARRRARAHRHRGRLPPRGVHAGDRGRRGEGRREGAVAAERHRERRRRGAGPKPAA